MLISSKNNIYVREGMEIQVQHPRGAMSESSEENQELTRERNNEESANSGATIMAAGEQGAVLRERVLNLEKELKFRKTGNPNCNHHQ
ncbi:hypothetical protein C0J52_17183 [Blattella germanica]|nr:hypothetical protein C0J52_17183 [Blattella germanica]